MIQKHLTEETAIFFSVIKWMFLSSLVGIGIGTVVSYYLKILAYSEDSRSVLPFSYYYLLPFALMLSVWLVKTFAPGAKGHGTEKVISAVHNDAGKIDVKVIPIKLFATIVTIFSGGSVGKEGPGAQIGAGFASAFAMLFKFSEDDRKKLVICGISAGFTTVFGTPIAGAIFGVEVLIIGVIMYDVLLPSIIAGFAAFTTAQFLGIEYTYYDFHFFQNVNLDIDLIMKVAISGLFFGLVAYFIIITVSSIEKLIKKSPINIYKKAFIAGVLLIVLTLIFGEKYLGLGLPTIANALNPHLELSQTIDWYTFMMKTLFTSVTLASGGSGGIITPIFYIGATSGHTFGVLFSPEHITLFAALGFVSVLSATTNAPIAATVMAIELFGIDVAHYAALSAIISFLISGHRSIFPSQKLAMKKSSMISIKMGEDIENIDINLDEKHQDKIKNIRNRFRRKNDLKD